MKKLSILFSIILVLTLVMAFKPAQAAWPDVYWLRFVGCTNNLPGDTAIGEAQMWVTIEPAGAGVEFTFYNVGDGQSSIADIYFKDGSLLGIASVTNSPTGVRFSEGASPPWLPGGNECGFLEPAEAHRFLADSDSPTQPNGVNQGPAPVEPQDELVEWVAITFSLKDGQTFDDVIAELSDGQLRLGIHVQGYAGGGSESFVTYPYTAVELVDFSAGARRANVGLNWTTGTEINNAGFNLYRSSSELGPRTRLNSALIAARGDAVSGGSYSFIDAPGYGTFYYWLEDVEASGSATLHGPIKVTVGIRLPVSRPAAP